jgi:hypothetical protein
MPTEEWVVSTILEPVMVRNLRHSVIIDCPLFFRGILTFNM